MQDAVPWKLWKGNANWCKAVNARLAIAHFRLESGVLIPNCFEYAVSFLLIPLEILSFICPNTQ